MNSSLKEAEEIVFAMSMKDIAVFKEMLIHFWAERGCHVFSIMVYEKDRYGNLTQLDPMDGLKESYLLLCLRRLDQEYICLSLQEPDVDNPNYRVQLCRMRTAPTPDQQVEERYGREYSLEGLSPSNLSHFIMLTSDMVVHELPDRYVDFSEEDVILMLEDFKSDLDKMKVLV